ncbi:MAG: methyltransferase [Caulobacteraceae bacterium]|nr:methyltransferase [Caulobacteraceae bacterium]
MQAVYGAPPADLAEVDGAAVQTSPLTPGSSDLAEIADESLDGVTMLAPPGTLERRYALAHALRAMKPGGLLLALAPKDKGGSRLGKELAGFGGQVAESGKRHHRICAVERPKDVTGIEQAIRDGGPRLAEGLGWTQPGVFSWDRIDPGSALLMEHLPALAGAGADFGCGLGLLARHVLGAGAVERLTLVDIDRRAVESARLNVEDARAAFEWADVRTLALSGLDFVVMNPPFHEGGAEERALGQGFIAAAAQALRAGGVCWLVANRHLPYEAALAESFKRVRLVHEGRAFKVCEAVR